jgi:hypothetical protein
MQGSGRWIGSPHSTIAANLQEQLQDLFGIAKKGMELNPLDNRIEEAYDKAFLALLSQNPGV